MSLRSWPVVSLEIVAILIFFRAVGFLRFGDTRLKSSDMKAGPILFVFFSLVRLRYVSDLSCLPFGSQLTVQEIVPRSAVASDFPQLLNGTNLLAPGPI